MVASLAGLVTACDDTTVTPEVESIALASPSGMTSASGNEIVGASAFLFDSATAVVLVPGEDPGAALARADELGVPALPDNDEGRAEAERLGARILDEDDAIQASPQPSNRKAPVTIATTADPSPALAQLAALGDAELIRIRRDPRRDPASIATLRERAEQPLLTIGALPYPVRVVRAGAETIAGGYLALPGHHYLAMYGHPQTSGLGVLGEQGPRESVVRVRKLVRKYRASDPKASFAPAFEIIATIASAGKGPRGDYSHRTPIRELRPLVDAAKKAGVTVILDLQPGRSDLLDQAKAYERLLREPHVGLAVDPEWKLDKHSRPLQRIGHLKASEINRTSAWLARLTRRHTLPQKLFVVHQFQTQMVRNRERLVTNRPELATIIHVDGQGPTGAKFGTWRMIRQDAPKGVHWGWKNFIDEDEPMLSTAETWRQVRPRPALITYQ